MARILITRRFPQNGLDDLIRENHELSYWTEDAPMTAKELYERCQGHSGLMCSGSERIDEDFFINCPSIQVVAQYAVGYDNIDVKAAQRRGIAIGNTPGAMTEATADIAFGLMLSTARRMFHWSRWIKTAAWNHFDPQAQLGLELNQKTLGIVGLGRIGARMAEKCIGAYSMNVIYHNRSRNEELENSIGAKYCTFDELLRDSDVISVHCPLNATTKHLFDAQAFEKMRSTAIFINTARGGVHQEEDLISALQDNKIWGAGLDVTNPEPMSPDNPLLEMENACVVPHIGSATFTARNRMSQMAAENLIAFFNQQPLPYAVGI